MHSRFELFVDEFAATTSFFTTALGFHIQRESPGYISLQNGDVTIGLGLISNLPDGGDSPGFTQARVNAARGAGVEIVLEVDDLDRALELYLTSEYPLIEPLQQRPWGLRDFRVAEPSGYYLRITEFEGR